MSYKCRTFNILRLLHVVEAMNDYKAEYRPALSITKSTIIIISAMPSDDDDGRFSKRIRVILIAS